MQPPYDLATNPLTHRGGPTSPVHCNEDNYQLVTILITGSLDSMDKKAHLTDFVIRSSYDQHLAIDAVGFPFIAEIPPGERGALEKKLC